MLNVHNTEERIGGIRMVHRGGYTCPIVFCSWCGKEIENAKEGNYEWVLPDADEVATEIFFTHKRCCAPFECRNRGSNFVCWSTAELRELPHFLAVNLELHWMYAPGSGPRLVDDPSTWRRKT